MAKHSDKSILPNTFQDRQPYVETDLSITPNMLHQGYGWVEWDGVTTGWSSGSAMFGTHRMPKAIRRRFENEKVGMLSQEKLFKLMDGYGSEVMNPSLWCGGIQVKPLTYFIQRRYPDRPVAVVGHASGKPPFQQFDDRYLRFIRIQWKGRSYLFLRGHFLVAEADGQVVAVVSPVYGSR